MTRPLTPKETEVITLITYGYSNKQVAHELGISHQTVKNHMTAILRKLRVDDRTQAVVCALYCGVVPLEDAYRAIVERQRYDLDGE